MASLEQHLFTFLHFASFEVGAGQIQQHFNIVMLEELPQAILVLQTNECLVTRA